MITIRDACWAAKIYDLPKEVNDYFDGDADEGVSELFIRKFGHAILGLGDAQYIMDHATDRSLLTDRQLEKAHEDSQVYTIDLKKLPTELERLELEIAW
jgi:hypothetical protein